MTSGCGSVGRNHDAIHRSIRLIWKTIRPARSLENKTVECNLRDLMPEPVAPSTWTLGHTCMQRWFRRAEPLERFVTIEIALSTSRSVRAIALAFGSQLHQAKDTRDPPCGRVTSETTRLMFDIDRQLPSVRVIGNPRRVVSVPMQRSRQAAMPAPVQARAPAMFVPVASRDDTPISTPPRRRPLPRAFEKAGHRGLKTLGLLRSIVFAIQAYQIGNEARMPRRPSISVR